MKRKSKGPVSISDVLSDILKSGELDKAITLKNMTDHWSNIVGDRIAEISEIKNFRGGKLYVSVPSSVWKMELSYKKKDILKKIQSHYNNDKVKEIIFL